MLKSPIIAPLVDGFCLQLAKIVYNFLHLFDESVFRQQAVIYKYSYSNAIEITKGCSNLEFLLTVILAIFAYPTVWLQRIKGIFLAIIVFEGVNLLRIITLLYFKAALTLPQFNVAHEQVWPYLLGLLHCVFFLFWAFYFTH